MQNTSMRTQDANPKNFVHNGNIIYTSPTGDFSIAIGEWDQDGQQRFAMRWNGDINNPNDKGYPSVFDNPMWFQLPPDANGWIKALISNCNLTI